MAVEKYGAECTLGMPWGTGKSQAWVWVEVTNRDENYCNVRIRGAVRSVSPYNISQYGVMVQVGQNGTNQWNEAGGVFNYGNWVGNLDMTYVVPRTQSNRNITCWTKYWGASVGGYGAGGWHGELYIDVTIPARPYYAHGNPTLNVSRTGLYQGEEVTFTWAKASNQGNANFERFELWRGDTKLYSGTGTSYKETPSTITGANGGSLVYTLKEIHEWYQTYPSTQAQKTVSVIKNFGKPKLTASTTVANYSQTINLNFAKATEQGNSTFNRFELWRGSEKLYSGSGTTYQINPSKYTGPKGGTVEFTLKEIHEWGGRYPETSTTLTITVRSGVVTAYDEAGKKHTGLVTVYDGTGKLRYVLITAYDDAGKPHSVV